MADIHHIIIDGYNYILRLQKINHSDENALWSAREEFVRKVISFRGNKRKKITIVFDGQDIKGITKIKRPAGINIRFSKAPQQADPVIISIVQKDPHPGTITLVTSDRGLAASAKSYGCMHMTVEAFRTKLTQSNNQFEYQDKYNIRMSEKDLEEWMNIFDQNDKKKS